MPSQLITDYTGSDATSQYLPYLDGNSEDSYEENMRRYRLNLLMYENMNRGIERRAMGGDVKAGQAYLVGDSPTGLPTGNEEIFVPNQDGTIVPSQNTQAMMQGDGAGLAEMSPYTSYLKALQEEVAAMNMKDDDIAAILLEGTGLERILLSGRKKKRNLMKVM